MTVKVNPDHLQNEVTLRLGQDLRTFGKMSCKSLINFLREAALQTDRKNDSQTDLIA